MSARGKQRPLIVPIFIPNQGCPYRCIYCQQEKITGQTTRPLSRFTVQEILDEALASPGFDRRKEREIAFYGGTFSWLPIRKMTELLEAASPYLTRRLFRSIRVSTRPDSLDAERLELMGYHRVSTVELGVQSMDDRVLFLSQRGHTARDTSESVGLLRRHGFKVGIQLMPGLPGDSAEVFKKTVDEVIRLRPDMVRLYPTLVISGTELARWYQSKKYQPLSLEEAVKICQDSCIRLEGNGIPVIRIGLMSSPSLLQEGQILGGPWHRSFGFLVRSGIHLEEIESHLPKKGEVKKFAIRAPSREIPLVRGYRNRGIRAIEEKTGALVTGVAPDDSVPAGQIVVDVM